MSKLNRFRNIDVSTATFPLALDLSSHTIVYKVTGTLAITTDHIIGPEGTAKEGMQVLIDYQATVTTSSKTYTIVVFGIRIPVSWLAGKLKIFCEYHAAAWDVWILPSLDTLHNIKLEMLDPGIVDDTTLAVDGTTGLFIVKTGGIGSDQLATAVKDGIAAKALGSDVTTLAGRVTATEGDITTLQGRATSDEGDITTLQGYRVTDSGAITVLQGYRVTDAAAIATLQGYRTTDSGNITTLQGLVAGILASSGRETSTIINADTAGATLYARVIADTSGNSVAYTLPALSGVNVGDKVTLQRIGGNAATLAPHAGDTLYPIGSLTADVASVAVSATGKSVTVIVTGVYGGRPVAWQVIEAT